MIHKRKDYLRDAGIEENAKYQNPSLLLLLFKDSILILIFIVIILILIVLIYSNIIYRIELYIVARVFVKEISWRENCKKGNFLKKSTSIIFH